MVAVIRKTVAIMGFNPNNLTFFIMTPEGKEVYRSSGVCGIIYLITLWVLEPI